MSDNISELKQRFNNISQSFTGFLSDYPFIIFLFVFFILAMYFINRFTPFRSTRDANKILSLRKTSDFFIDIYPLKILFEKMNKSSTVDMEIYIPGTTKNDRMPTETTKLIDLQMLGAAYCTATSDGYLHSEQILQNICLLNVPRVYHIQLYDQGYGPDQQFPIVATGKQNWITSYNTLDLHPVLNIIRQRVMEDNKILYGGTVDPTIIYLQCKGPQGYSTVSNKTLNEAGKTIKKILGEYFPDPKYGHGGGHVNKKTDKTLLNTPVKDLYNNIIIASDTLGTDSTLAFSECIHLCTETKNFVATQYPLSEEALKAKDAFIYVDPDFNNYNPYIPIINNVNCIGMHFSDIGMPLYKAIKLIGSKQPMNKTSDVSIISSFLLKKKVV